MKNYEQYKRLIRFGVAVIILAIEIGIYWVIWNGYLSGAAGNPFWRRGDWLMVTVYGLLLLFFSKLYGALKIGYLEKGNIIYSQILSILLVNGITYLQIALLAKAFLSLSPFLFMCIFDIAAISVWTFLTNKLFQHLFPPRKIALIRGERPILGFMGKINTRKDRYEICEIINIEIGYDKVIDAIEEYNAVLLCDIPSEIRNHILKYCFSRKKRVYMSPKISDILIRSASDINLFDTPLILTRNGDMSIEQQILKRITDFFIASAGCIILMPFMICTAVAIKLQDGGPVLYKQKRLTLDGKEFSIYKFRSMRVDAENDGIARLAKEEDDRITFVGRIIRKIRFDELPQLFNVIKGDMSIVGPRPERPEIAEQYRMEMPEFEYRLRAKAGITGYAQIYGKYNTTPYDKLKMDLTYIQNYSILLDFKLMILTVKILFMKESTEGIADNQITASAKGDK